MVIRRRARRRIIAASFLRRRVRLIVRGTRGVRGVCQSPVLHADVVCLERERSALQCYHISTDRHILTVNQDGSNTHILLCLYGKARNDLLAG